MKKERKINKRSLGTYFRGQEKYKYQYGNYITNSFSVLEVNCDELERSDKLEQQLERFISNFEEYNYCFSVQVKDILGIDDKFYKLDFTNYVDKKYLNDMNYGIGIKELKRVNNLIKIDTINVKMIYRGGYTIILELMKNDERIGYLVPMRWF